MKLTQLKQTAGTHIIVFGAPKTGKSQLAGELAQHYKLLWIDLENGWEVLTKLPHEWQENIEIVKLPDSRVFPVGIQTMLKLITGSRYVVCDEHGVTGLGETPCAICKKNPEATWTAVELNALDPKEWIVVVDTVNQLSVSAMAHLTKSQPDDYKPDWDDFMKQGVLMDKFFSQVQQAKFNIICISHETETEMDDGKKKLVPIGGTTNFSRNVAKYFGHVVHTEVKNKKHTFGSATTFSLNALTGSRTDVAIESMGDKASLLPFFRSGIVDRTNESVVQPQQVRSIGGTSSGTSTVQSNESATSPSLSRLQALRAAQGK